MLLFTLLSSHEKPANAVVRDIVHTLYQGVSILSKRYTRWPVNLRPARFYPARPPAPRSARVGRFAT